MAFGDEILNMIKNVRQQELERRTECPECGYPLDETPDGLLYCRFCGWNEAGLAGRRG